MLIRLIVLLAIMAAFYPTKAQADWPPEAKQASKALCRVVALQQPTRGRFSATEQNEFLGSGCLVASDDGGAFVLTAHHVVEANPVSITIEFWNGESTTAKLLAYNRKYDQALLKLSVAPNGVDPVDISIPDSAVVPIGQTLYFAGYAGGDNLVTYEAEKVRTISPQDGRFFQGIANRSSKNGMSGGPVFNRRGQLIGNLFGKQGPGVREPQTHYNGPLVNAWFLSRCVPRPNHRSTPIQKGVWIDQRWRRGKQRSEICDHAGADLSGADWLVCDADSRSAGNRLARPG